ncbi:alpha-actinin sarcomeric-like protein [Anaeramoeba ignava]|uniref:Alpha-actinin sarcomeric-like protein n=1 Tax=Anaeramoeba ignava TaxID=1746090 RepID=A0A9Q0LIL8_ANAIG|nr:alpha-actinin sarcomeric-like protein [Anaeramoeba ignava]
MKEELRQKKDYEEQAKKWMDEVNGMIEKLKEREFDNTLEGAIAKNSELTEFMSTQHSEKSAQKSSLFNRSDNINGYMKSLPYHRPEFAHPEGLSPKDLDEKWKELLEVEEARKKDINTELVRQEKCDDIQKKFHERAAKMEKWNEKQEKYLKTEEDIQTLRAAQIQLRKLDNFKKDLDYSEKQVDQLKEMAKDLKELNYHKIDEVEDRMNKLEEHWKSLFELHDTKKNSLEESLKLEENKDALRKEFAEKAGAYRLWCSKSIAECRDAHFGSSLEEVQNFKEVLESKNKEMTTKSEESKTELENLSNQLTELKVADNRYTRLTIEDVKSSHNDLMEAIQNRTNAYETELARQQAMEDKRIEFAKHADEFVKFLDQKKQQLDQVQGEPEEKIEEVKKIYNEGTDANEMFEKLVQIDDEAKSMEIVQNKHTEFDIQILTTKKKWYDNYVKNLLASIEEEKKMKERAAQLQKEWEEQRRKEEMIQEYASKSQSLNTWLDIAHEKTTDPITSTTPKDNEELTKDFHDFFKNKDDKEKDYEELQELAKKMTEANITNFSGLPIETVTERWNEIDQLIDERKKDLEKDKKKQEKHEDKRKKFAEKANHFNEFLEKTKKSITEVTGSPSEQLDKIKKYHSELLKKEDNLEELISLGANLEKHHILNNPYTTFTAQSSKQAYEELVNYSNKLQETITNTILESQGKKVTDQQMKEFREVFDHFAKTNGALDKLSFSGCLKGLGEHMTDGEIAKVFDSFETDKSGKMEFDEFVRFMASRTVDMDTKEQILESFRDLSKNPPVITESEMRDYFPQEQVDYFKQHMTPQGEGYNYESWTDEAFNR